MQERGSAAVLSGKEDETRCLEGEPGEKEVEISNVSDVFCRWRPVLGVLYVSCPSFDKNNG